nr:heavy metal-associated domain-containing protein [uncultured Campylobacter sp.]
MRKILFLMLGFTALFADKEVKIYVQKIHCPLCTTIVRKALLQTPGVISAKVSQQSKTATVVAKDDANETAMLEAIAKTGYEGVIVK